MEYLEQRKSIIAAGKKLRASGLVARTWGNVSVRVDEGSFLITPSGLDYDVMLPEDIVLVDIQTGEYAGHRKPSVEKGVHIAAYRAFPDVGAVIHTHQRYATAIGLSGYSRIELNDDERARLGGLSLSKYGLPGTKPLSQSIAKEFSGGAHCVFMPHHGVVAAGADIDDAFARLCELEQICMRSCPWQPSSDDKAQFPEDIIAAVAREFAHYTISSAPQVVYASRFGGVRAMLDDMAQMMGAKLRCVDASADKVVSALKKHEAVLVRGCGAVFASPVADNCEALHIIAESACLCYAAATVEGKQKPLGRAECALMRLVYLKKYSKLASGK